MRDRVNTEKRRQMASRMTSNLQAVLFYIAIIVVWELISRAGIVRPFVLPAPTTIVDAIVAEWEDLVAHSLVTLREILLGFILGSGLGFLLALGIFYSPFLRRIIYPGVLFMQTVPKVALAPLFIVWFGVGETSIVAITALICLFPVLINTIVGFESTDKNLLEMMHSVSASGWQKFRMVYVPSGMPAIMAGLGVASTLAVVGALVGEFVGARAGLGYAILMANSRLRTDIVFATLFAVAFIGMLCFFAIKSLEWLVLGRRSGHRSREP